MREIAPPFDVTHVSQGRWRCSRAGCSFTRYYGTQQGAVMGAGRHLMDVHQVKLVIPRDSSLMSREYAVPLNDHLKRRL